MEPVVHAAERFGFHAPFFESLTDGLIHQTYKVTLGSRSIILQQVNGKVFTDIELVIDNYKVVYNHIRNHEQPIPSMITTTDNEDFWIDKKGSYWRAFEYLPNTYTESLPADPQKIFNAAKCYGEFTQALSGLNTDQLKPAIPGFHDVSNRHRQLKKALPSAQAERLEKSKTILGKIEQRNHLVDFYNDLNKNPEFRLRAMHHDTKLSNILFDKTSELPVCPIDLDTVMPGYFFSDVGDMVRSMVSVRNEHAPADSVKVDPLIYRAIVSGYQVGMGNVFTQTEKDHLHHAGMIMLYMQGVRFITDYLSNDVYYKTDHPEQNLNRALNQITLLEKLEEFLQQEYQYTIK